MQEQESHRIQMEGITIECRVDDSLMPAIQRALTGTTPHDSEIDKLPLPKRPTWLYLVVRLLKWYRGVLGPYLGNRCVFEPSCSRYSELAFRKYGFSRGITLTVGRLFRCRPGSGSIDIP